MLTRNTHVNYLRKNYNHPLYGEIALQMQLELKHVELRMKN